MDKIPAPNHADPPGLNFQARYAGKTRAMRYVYPDTDHEAAGWILWKHPDGLWVTLRKATEADIEEMSAAVSRDFHAGY
jgi:hypothetical protein